MKLSSSYLLHNQHLYADNFYSSLGLIRDLHDAIAYFCGTIWKNSRGLPKQISDMALQRGQSEKLSADRDIVFCRWYDRRDVFVVAMNTTGRDTVKPQTHFTPNDMITVPEMIVDYNWNTGGVDHLDQFRGYYNVGRAGSKWWKYVLFGLFNFAMVNAYILKCLVNRPLPSNQREWSLLTCRMAVMHQMCDNFSSRKRAMGSIHAFLQTGARRRSDVLKHYMDVRCVGCPCASQDHVPGSTMASSLQHEQTQCFIC